MAGYDQLRPDIFGAVQRGKEVGRQNNLRNLSAQYFANGQQADPAFLGQAAQQGGPDAAAYFQKDQQAQKAQKFQQIGQAAAWFTSLPPEAKPQAYQQLAQLATSAGFQVSPTYDPKHEEPIAKLAQMFGPKAAEGMAPRVVGNSLVDPTGKVLYSAPTAAPKPIWDSQRGAFIYPPGGAPAAPQGQPSSVQFDFAPGTSPEIQDAIRAAAAADQGQQPQSGQPRMVQVAPPRAVAQTALQQRLDMAKQMGATPDQLKAIVLGGSGGQGAPMVLGDATKNGPEYLASLSPQDAMLVKAMAEGRKQYPTGNALKDPHLLALAASVQQYDPTSEEGSFKTRLATRAAFTSGKPAQQINAMNTTAGHLMALAEATKALHNSSIPVWNTIGNAATKATGSPAVTNFMAAVGPVANEMEAIYRANGGSEEGVRQFREALDPNGSPEQINGTLRMFVTLIKSKLDAMSDQYTQGMGTMNTPLHFINPKARAVYDQLNRLAKELGKDPAAMGLDQQPTDAAPQGSPTIVRYDAQGNRLP